MTRKPSRKTDPLHDDMIKWKHFQRYWPFVRGTHQSPVNSPHKGQWRGALIFSLIYAWTNGWVNNNHAGDLRRHHAHYDVTVIFGAPTLTWGLPPQMSSSMEFWCFLGYYPEKAIQLTAGLPVIYLPMLPSWLSLQTLNTLRPRQNGRHFADDTFKRIFMNETVRISINISLKFVPNGLINNTPALVQIMAWRRPGDKPLSEPMMVNLLTHICVTRPQWVNHKHIGNALLNQILGWQNCRMIFLRSLQHFQSNDTRRIIYNAMPL